MKKEIYKQSETVIINRSQINFAPYNPRKEDKKIVDELKKNFKKVAFLGGIVWNKTTSNLVGGHKRIQALDILNNYDGLSDYQIKVESIELDEKTEKEQNIFLNNKKVQGSFDYSLLAIMVNEGIEIQNCGLDNSDLQMISSISPNINFGNNSELKSELKNLEKNEQEKKNHVKNIKKEMKENNKKIHTPSYVVLSFNNSENKCKFLERFDFNPTDEYINGELLNDIVERID